MFGKFAQLHVNYRGSSLSRHEDRRNWFTRTGTEDQGRGPRARCCLPRCVIGPDRNLIRLIAAASPRGADWDGINRRHATCAPVGGLRFTDPASTPISSWIPASQRLRHHVNKRATGHAQRKTDALGHASVKVTSHKRPPQAKLPCLRDAHGDFRRLYGMAGDFLCLIRPDDHVGLFQRPINEASLDDYLGMLGTALHSEGWDSPPGWSAADSQRGTEREHVRTS